MKLFIQLKLIERLMELYSLYGNRDAPENMKFTPQKISYFKRGSENIAICCEIRRSLMPDAY
jgi:hypothetical protein